MKTELKTGGPPTAGHRIDLKFTVVPFPFLSNPWPGRWLDWLLTEFSLIRSRFTVCFFLIGCRRVLIGFTRLYWVLPSFGRLS